jgi:hypothetical protein
MKGGATMQKKDYSKYYDPIFEEVCDRAEELARADGEDREGVLSVIRHPVWAGPPLPPLDKYVPWAKEMRQRAAAQMKAEQKVEQEAANPVATPAPAKPKKPEGELFPKNARKPGARKYGDMMYISRHGKCISCPRILSPPASATKARNDRKETPTRHLLFAA